MKLEDFFLICFGIGATFTIVSFVIGRLHIHVPHKAFLPHFGNGGHAGHGTHSAPGKFIPKGMVKGHAGNADAAAPTDFTYVSPFNFMSLMTFLAWFGGVGFLASHKYGIGLYLALFAALIGGAAGGGVVYLFLRKVLSYEKPLDPADFEMVGVVGKLSIGIRAAAGGTGEVIYEQQGTMRCCGARTEDGSALTSGTEVVITAFEHGIATVKRWEEFTEM